MSQGMITRSRVNSQPSTFHSLPFCNSNGSKKTKKFDEIEEPLISGKSENSNTIMTSQGEQQSSQNDSQRAEDITPEKWLIMFNNLNTTLSSLQQEIQDLKTAKGSEISLPSVWTESADKAILDSDRILELKS